MDDKKVWLVYSSQGRNHHVRPSDVGPDMVECRCDNETGHLKKWKDVITTNYVRARDKVKMLESTPTIARMAKMPTKPGRNHQE